MQDKVKAVAAARADYETAKADLDAKRKAWEDEYRTLIDTVANLKECIENSEAVLRTAAEDAFKETGDRKPVDGVEIKMFNRFAVCEEDARGWCLINMPALLVVNMPAYEKVCEVVGDSLEMPGEYTHYSKVTLARDLSKYLVLSSVDAEQHTSPRSLP